MGRWRWHGLVGAAFAIAGLVGATSCAVDRVTSTADHREGRTYTVSDTVRTLKVRAIAGRVEIEGDDRSSVAVEEELRYDDRAPTTRHAVRDGVLTLDYTCPDQQGQCWVDYVVRVPRDLRLDVRTDAGGIWLRETGGPVRAVTTAGQVDGKDLASPEVTVDSTAGTVRLQFAEAPREVDAHATAGSITVRLPDGGRYAVDAQTAAGQTEVGVPVDANSPNRVIAASSAGSVRVLPDL